MINRVFTLQFRIARYLQTVLTVAGVACAMLLPLKSWGAEDPSVTNNAEVKVSPVTIDGIPLFYVLGITSLPSEQRAAQIRERIIQAADNPAIKIEDIKMRKEDNGRVKIVAGNSTLAFIVDEDAAIEHVDLSLLTEVIHSKITKAVTAYRYDRSRDHLIKKSLYSLGAILGAILMMFIVSWSLRKINNALQRRIQARIDRVENKSFKLIRSVQIWRTIHVLFGLIKTVLIAVILTSSIVYCLSLFPWTRGLAAVTLDSVLNPVFTLGKGFVEYFPNLIFLLVIFLFTRYALKLLNLFFIGVSEGGISLKSVDPEMAMPMFRIFRIMVIAFAVIMAYPYIPGSDSAAFKGVSVFLGILFSLGSSSFIGNAIAGYSMTFRKAFRTGDRIMVDGTVGFVEEQKTMVTRIRTVKNEEVIMPNSVLINSSIVNYSTKARQGGIIVHTSVGIGYETPWRQVDAMLILAANRTPGLLTEPSPYVLKKALGDFAVDYEINAYCKDAERIARVYSELHEHILDIFNENNVQIMTPGYEGDPEVPKVVPKEKWYTPLVSTNGLIDKDTPKAEASAASEAGE